ncbi:MAG: hypothetical protein HYU64_09545 [Armatimonadetes bacterium]|nr:hypothetical protein [Armatimonadota bacterium]
MERKGTHKETKKTHKGHKKLYVEELETRVVPAKPVPTSDGGDDGWYYYR